MHKLALLGCLMLASIASADELGGRQVALAQQENDRAKTAREGSSSAVTIDAKTEAGLLKFIEEHQPKLLALMSFLKEKQPSAYQQALRELARNQQRLDGLAKRDPQLYAVELELWQTRSHLRLLAAEMSVAKNPNNEKLSSELSRLVELEAEQDLARLRILRERAAQQVSKLDEDIRKRTGEHDELVAKSLKSWQNRIRKQSPRTKNQSD